MIASTKAVSSCRLCLCHALNRRAASGPTTASPGRCARSNRASPTSDAAAIASVGHRAAGSPRTQPSCRGRTDDCIARMMRKSTTRGHLRTPRYCFCRALDCWFATFRSRGRKRRHDRIRVSRRPAPRLPLSRPAASCAVGASCDRSIANNHAAAPPRRGHCARADRRFRGGRGSKLSFGGREIPGCVRELRSRFVDAPFREPEPSRLRSAWCRPPQRRPRPKREE